MLLSHNKRPSIGWEPNKQRASGVDLLPAVWYKSGLTPGQESQVSTVMQPD